eukprot:3284892-Rhodomonas_salina.1
MIAATVSPRPGRRLGEPRACEFIVTVDQELERGRGSQGSLTDFDALVIPLRVKCCRVSVDSFSGCVRAWARALWWMTVMLRGRRTGRASHGGHGWSRLSCCWSVLARFCCWKTQPRLQVDSNASGLGAPSDYIRRRPGRRSSKSRHPSHDRMMRLRPGSLRVSLRLPVWQAQAEYRNSVPGPATMCQPEYVTCKCSSVYLAWGTVDRHVPR